MRVYFDIMYSASKFIQQRLIMSCPLSRILLYTNRWRKCVEPYTDMKTILISILLQLSSIYLFGQATKPIVFQHYEHKEKTQPFLTRWYWTIRGESPYAWKETLLLMTDSSFVYKYEGGDCGTFDHTAQEVGQ